ncbi:Nucleotide-binding universal stress protein, UspA family [Devosia enhydra]|uniref:Nucleotide-binding universal stress protein, UspA family n=2 Tax=Devosia enhydra TaxID=665118 RepID=A0A1K2HXV7_9HYPH|nr:Nucleotide-binding universal stress protein, UspA family [Devosia enhydra]
MLNDVLIPLRTQPLPDTPETARSLLRLAATFCTHASLCPLEVSVRRMRHWSAAFSGLGEASVFERVSRENADCLLAVAKESHQISVSARVLPIVLGETMSSLSLAARCHDMTMIAFTDPKAGAALAEVALFGTGRPAMLIPSAIPDGPRPFARVAIAWDGSATASRALRDAMPLIVAADKVVVINAPADKALESGCERGLTDYLARRRINAKFVKVDTEILDIGLALQHSAGVAGADLLVMGAYGHSRLQQFILGGATRGVLTNLQLPVLMSHS